jgi:hypothetical protein
MSDRSNPSSNIRSHFGARLQHILTQSLQFVSMAPKNVNLLSAMKAKQIAYEQKCKAAEVDAAAKKMAAKEAAKEATKMAAAARATARRELVRRMGGASSIRRWRRAFPTADDGSDAEIV